MWYVILKPCAERRGNEHSRLMVNVLTNREKRFLSNAKNPPRAGELFLLAEHLKITENSDTSRELSPELLLAANETKPDNSTRGLLLYPPACGVLVSRFPADREHPPGAHLALSDVKRDGTGACLPLSP